VIAGHTLAVFRMVGERENVLQNHCKHTPPSPHPQSRHPPPLSFVIPNTTTPNYHYFQ
jgi:hypothetical protein